MMQIGLIGIGAGAAAALLFASVASGTLLSIPLFYLAPLPILIAALGWSHWAALIAALVGAVALAAAFGTIFFFGFLAGAGAPAWWLGYLAMLARPVAAGTANGNPALEWYPPGRLVVWAAALAALMVILAIPLLGTSAEAFRTGMHNALLQILRAQTEIGTAPPANLDRVVDYLVAVVPPAGAVVATITSLINLWLAARVVRLSGLLKRPWPELPALTLPQAGRSGVCRSCGGKLHRRTARHCLRRRLGKPVHGLRRARPCRVAHHHQAARQPCLPAWRHLCRDHGAGLAADRTRPARPRRNRLRPARAACRAARTAGANLRDFSSINRNQTMEKQQWT